MAKKNPENSNLRKKVLRMESFLDLDRFGKEDRVSDEEIAEYYKVNDFAYKKWLSKYGFMHFCISKTGNYSPEDAFYQPKTVAGFIKPGNKVLELGFGKGPNIFYLAEKFPDVEFCGVDLAPTNDKNKFPNVKLYQHNYSDLSGFADNTFDVVYGIETICCCNEKDKDTVFREVYRVLKPGGHFMVFDFASPEAFETYDPVAQKGLALFTRAGWGALITSVDQWEKHFTANGFICESITDLSKEVLPDLKRLLDTLGMRLMRSKVKAKMAFSVLPEKFVGNGIVAYIAYDCFKEGFATYKQWIYVK
ncbi:MAG: methyltransferase domain-containing protein [Acidaminococcaceae bacterium]|nr:methyltransferase domain-containing protein [Acidaminococcaceae bacterium]